MYKRTAVATAKATAATDKEHQNDRGAIDYVQIRWYTCLFHDIYLYVRWENEQRNESIIKEKYDYELYCYLGAQQTYNTLSVFLYYLLFIHKTLYFFACLIPFFHFEEWERKRKRAHATYFVKNGSNRVDLIGMRKFFHLFNQLTIVCWPFSVYIRIFCSQYALKKKSTYRRWYFDWNVPTPRVLNKLTVNTFVL